jgi:hypothetical protein
MNSKDAAAIKALSELGLRKEVPLTPEQEQILKQALDPQEQFYADIIRIFDVDLRTNPPTVG